jgi:F-type H+-transporting ATPase subunit gamma
MALRASIQRVSRDLPRLMAKAGAARGMATEKQIFNQIQSSANIQKITSSMKMVSAAKLKGDETRLALAKPFNQWTDALCGEAVIMDDLEQVTFEELPQKTLLVPISSDKGLCGGINTFISRCTKDAVAKLTAQGKECDVVVIGDKGRSQLSRAIPEKIVRTATEVAAPGRYNLAAALSSELTAAGAADYDEVVVIYNSFVNAATYKQYYKVIKPMVVEGENESMVEYEFEPDVKSEVMTDLYEYVLTSQLYYCFMDGAASEQSSRMTAMENASKNAGEMIDSLTLQYNRARQARITTELIEIISGASALED